MTVQALPCHRHIADTAQVVTSSAGRTDKGTSACGQTISFYTWRNDITPSAVELAISSAAPASLRAVHAQCVPRSFHATFQVCDAHLSSCDTGACMLLAPWVEETSALHL